ncbi:hypothetical protein FQN54_009430 [Arachnomyces sp. PD_36]|nr:hypothetical protein FQN54_009430 [Arachnomyces sp. PD_36]
MSRFSNILPLILLFIGVGIAAFIGYVVYSIVMDVKSQTKKKMEKKNVMFSRDGMKVGVKELNDEEYKDRSQSVLVNVWNQASFPAYKSRIWGNGSKNEKKKH